MAGRVGEGKISMLPEKIRERIQVSETECWEWIGTIRPDGYGLLYSAQHKRQIRAHRVVFSFFMGELTKGLVIDHLCRNRKCVNPSHLRETTQRENTICGVGPAAKKHAQTECVKGHPFDEQNTYIPPKRGTRHCRKCTTELSALRRRGERGTGQCSCGRISYARGMCQSCYMHWYRGR